MDMNLVSFSTTPDPRFLDLVWDEFFRARNRGCSLRAHFPWIADSSASTLYARIEEGSEFISGLVMKDGTYCMRGRFPRVALIGLVCVRPQYRGRGFSRELLTAAIERARGDGYDALTLWTGKPQVYERLGFQLEDRSLFGWVVNPDASDGVDPFVYDCSCDGTVCEKSMNIALPPFASAGVILRNGNAAATIVADNVGPILAETGGEADDVVELLGSAMPRRWRMNALMGDPILSLLRQKGWQIELEQVHLQMWISLSEEFAPKVLADLGRFTVLDRI